ncbi:MAG: hypothetical protein ABL887_03570 [Nitrosomonas sp.]
MDSIFDNIPQWRWTLTKNFTFYQNDVQQLSVGYFSLSLQLNSRGCAEVLNIRYEGNVTAMLTALALRISDTVMEYHNNLTEVINH